MLTARDLLCACVERARDVAGAWWLLLRGELLATPRKGGRS